MSHVDPSGQYECSGPVAKCQAFESARKANLMSSRSSQAVKDASAAFGELGQENGVVVQFGKTPHGKGATGTLAISMSTSSSTTATVTAQATFTFNERLKGNQLQAAVAHEGTHLVDAQRFAASFTADASRWNNALDLTGRQTETEAYRFTAEVANLTNATFEFDGGTFRPLMPPAEIDRAIDDILKKTYEPEYLTNSAFNWGLKSPE